VICYLQPTLTYSRSWNQERPSREWQWSKRRGMTWPRAT
jgi:hypothetical protein